MRVGTVGQETVPMKCAESRNFRLYGSMGCHRRPLRKKERRRKKKKAVQKYNVPQQLRSSGPNKEKKGYFTAPSRKMKEETPVCFSLNMGDLIR